MTNLDIPGRYLFTVTYSHGEHEKIDSRDMSIDALMYELDKCSIDKITVELNPAWLDWPATKKL